MTNPRKAAGAEARRIAAEGLPAVVLVGRANAGKSTLFNRITKGGRAIISAIPGTTRDLNFARAKYGDREFVVIDSGGLELGGHERMTERIVTEALAAVGVADVVVFMLDGRGGLSEADAEALALVRETGCPLIMAVNKIDRISPRARLLPYIAELAKRLEFRGIVPVSARKADQIDALRNLIAQHLPVAPAMFAAGMLTDRDLSFRIAELIRERLTLELNQEVPYGIAVEVENLAEEQGQLRVDASIWVDRAGQKPIVIGAGGERLKRVGRAVRLQLNDMLGRRVHLELWVKVREDWADDARSLRELGVE